MISILKISVICKFSKLNPQPAKKEETMQKSTYEILGNLAGQVNNDEYSNAFDTTNINPLIKEQLVKMRAEETTIAAREAAKEIITVLKNADTFIERSRMELASIRASARRLKNYIRQVAVLREYGNLTSDYRPLYLILTGTAPVTPVVYIAAQLSAAEANVDKLFAAKNETSVSKTAVKKTRNINKPPIETSTGTR